MAKLTKPLRDILSVLMQVGHLVELLNFIDTEASKYACLHISGRRLKTVRFYRAKPHVESMAPLNFNSTRLANVPGV